MTPDLSPSPGLLNCRDAAAYLGGISTRHLYSLTAPRGPIPSVRLGNRVMYAIDTLRAYIDAELIRQNPPASA